MNNLFYKLVKKTYFFAAEQVVEFYKSQSVFAGLLGDIKVNEILDSGGSIDDKMVSALIQARISELDVLHRFTFATK
jgi:hypothetical protein